MIGLVFADEGEAKTMYKKVSNRKQTAGGLSFISLALFLTPHSFLL